MTLLGQSITAWLVALSHNRTERIQFLLIASWAVAMIGLPIARWMLGDGITPHAVTFALMFQFLAVIYALRHGWGWQRALGTLAAITIATWGIEFIGSSTGFPFGGYQYTDALAPQIRHVPLLVPLAWFMMLPSSWAVAHCIVGNTRDNRLSYALFILVSGVAIAAWDLFLDPQMVAWGFWQWDLSSTAYAATYFGIPWVNYGGWVLTGIIVTLIIRPDRTTLPIKPLLIIYGITWFLETFGLALFWGLVGPALVGGVVMGSLLVWSVRSYVRELNI